MILKKDTTIEGDRLNSTNPWLSIWFSPRKSIRTALTYGLHKRAAILLSFVFGGLITFWFARTETLFMAANGAFIPLLITVIIGSLTGPLLYYGFGFAFGHVGTWYGGNGNIEATRKVFVYALFMPGILLGLASLILSALALLQFQLQSTFFLGFFRFGSFLLDLATIWLFVIFLIAYAEAQKIKVWRSLLIVIAIVGCMAMIFIAVNLISHLFS
ncbi:hypothetical protein JOC54_004598 [Alkalihalobacillus xiaoxiensis]|uniref:Yip1 domain-containing protein n=1 Tax=Shouchella xiaoxiensis TaxID=766895 RepID=A0ABS2T1B9_9BACI|nr:YIP1 family protein [Shouchella xiaoxiensis]MBM7841295.1 hypothetical protein [Shouchella xiaoxiensis]